MGFTQIFKDNNSYNEKTIIGFFSFVIMSIIAITDTVMAILGKSFAIHEFIYDSFATITLGSFGIAEIGKVVSKFSSKRSTPPDIPQEENGDSDSTAEMTNKQNEEPPEQYS